MIKNRLTSYSSWKSLIENAIVNTSALFEYLPGRIWTGAAQLAWLKKYNITKSIILDVKLIAFLTHLPCLLTLLLFICLGMGL
jgi:hypothetical protein